jgi:hypothetical protein
MYIFDSKAFGFIRSLKKCYVSVLYQDIRQNKMLIIHEARTIWSIKIHYIQGGNTDIKYTRKSLDTVKGTAVPTHAIKAVQRHSLLTSTLDGGEWSNWHRSYFTSGERFLSTHWTERLGGLQNRSEDFGESIRLLLLQRIKPSFLEPPSHSLVTIPTELFRFLEIGLFLVQGPAADATDAQQPRGLLCNPVMKMISVFVFSV